MSEILDNIIVDLKVIQNVHAKGRLCTTSHGHLKLEIEGNYAKIKRTMNGDSRNRLINRLKSLTSGITEISDNIISSLYFIRHYEGDRMNMFQINENSKKCHQLKKLSRELGNCDEGLLNLKNTYGNDVRVNAELEQIADKFKEQIKKIDKALKLIDEEEKRMFDSPASAPASAPAPPSSQTSNSRTNLFAYNRDRDSDEDDDNIDRVLKPNVHNQSASISTDPFE
jgi:hypothetical protein